MATNASNPTIPQENFTSLDISLKMILSALTEDNAGPAVPPDPQFDPEEPGSAIP